MKILEADKTTTGKWFKPDPSPEGLALLFVVDPGGGSVTIEGTYNSEDGSAAALTFVDGETDACTIFAKNKPNYTKVRARVVDPTGIASVEMN